MNAMKLGLSFAAVFLLAAEKASGQASYCVDGTGNTADASFYNAHVCWLPGVKQASKGGVNLKEVEKSKVVYQVLSDKTTLPMMDSVAAGLSVPVFAYVTGFKVRYSTVGSCGRTVTTAKSNIVVTLTDTHIKVECPGHSYGGDARENNPLKLRRLK